MVMYKKLKNLENKQIPTFDLTMPGNLVGNLHEILEITECVGSLAFVEFVSTIHILYVHNK